MSMLEKRDREMSLQQKGGNRWEAEEAMNRRGDSIEAKETTRLDNSGEKKESISRRGKIAYQLVDITHHLPGLIWATKRGAVQNLRTRFERKWHCPVGYGLSYVELSHCRAEYLHCCQIPGSYKPWSLDGETPVPSTYGKTPVQRFQKQGGRKESVPGILLQLHGGGYYGRLHNTYRDMAVAYSTAGAGLDVCSPDYRTAPRHTFPAALEDALEAYRYCLSRLEPGQRLYVAGDSAGGGLALALVLYLRDHGLRLPDGVITMSAWTDLMASGSSYGDNYQCDPMFGRIKNSLVFANNYPKGFSRKSAYISPAYGSYEGFPRTLMQVGEQEMLLSDTIEVCRRIRKAGGECKLHVYNGMFHDFQMGLGLFPEADRAWREIQDWFRQDKGKEDGRAEYRTKGQDGR